MQATDLGMIKPDVVVEKRLRCSSCGKRLGRYEVGFYWGDVFPDFLDLIPIRLPFPMRDVGRGTRPRPQLFFMQESDEMDGWQEPDGPDSRVDTAAEIGPRYRWRCGCGAEPVWRGTQLAQRWECAPGVEYV